MARALGLGSGGNYTNVEPRQPITAVPYAITAGNVTGAIADGQLSANIASNESSLATAERARGQADNRSSLVLAGERLYAVNQGGDGFVFKASPQFKVVSTNALGELTRASAAVSDGELFIRTYKNLWCVSEKTAGNKVRRE